MKLFLLKRNDDLNFNEMRSCVVCAIDEMGARDIASRFAGDEGASIWKLPGRVAIKYLAIARKDIEPGIVCRDFIGG